MIYQCCTLKHYFSFVVFIVICSCSHGSSAKLKMPVGQIHLSVHYHVSQLYNGSMCLRVCSCLCVSECKRRVGNEHTGQRDGEKGWMCACVSAPLRVCILFFKLTHPDTALQRLGPHVNVCHMKLLIFQKQLIFFLPLAVMRSLGVLNIPLIELICSLLPHVISVQLVKCLLRFRS